MEDKGFSASRVAQLTNRRCHTRLTGPRLRFRASGHASPISHLACTSLIVVTLGPVQIQPVWNSPDDTPHIQKHDDGPGGTHVLLRV